MASTTASSLAGAWFGELASAVQGTWQAAAAAAAASHGEHRPRQQPAAPARRLGGRRGDDGSRKAARGAAAAAGGKQAARDKEGEGDGDVVRCGGAMSDTTLYMLLDRFSPS